jgi:hypothetical protein
MVPPNPNEQSWPWWPLLPLYPYGSRRTLFRELVPGQVWAFEQLQGVFQVAVPIRMTAIKLQQGLLLYAPVAATAECLKLIRCLEEEHGPVCTIVHPSSSGLEHKVGVPAMARAFPEAQLWVSPQQWSFPLRLPLSWLGFPADRTRQLFDDGVPHGDQLEWLSLGPVPLGPGPFYEATPFHRSSGTLLVTDALISVADCWPELLDIDPRPLLYHGREDGNEPMQDTPERRLKGWRRLALFACYLRPAAVQQVWRRFPFRWQPGWEASFHGLSRGGALQVAPILEELVFPRNRAAMAAWLESCSRLRVQQVVAAHFLAPVAANGSDFLDLADCWAQGNRLPEAADRELLRMFNKRLEQFGLVPGVS